MKTYRLPFTLLFASIIFLYTDYLLSECERD